MNQSTTGWILFIGSVGMMCTLIAVDVTRLSTWNDAFSPSFVGIFLAHMGVVIAAFVAGKIIPTDRDPTDRTRSDDTISKSTLIQINKENK